MIARTVIYADEGKILTNGEIYGKQIFLAEGASKADFYEISEDDYEEILRAHEAAEVGSDLENGGEVPVIEGGEGA